MLAATKLAKLEKELSELQVNCSARILDINDAKRAIENAEIEVMKLPLNFRKYATFQFVPWSIAASYKYSAHGTGLLISFSRSGKAVSVTAERERVYANERVRFDITYKNLDKFIVDELKITQENITDELRKFTLKSNGFNSTHYTKSV